MKNISGQRVSLKHAFLNTVYEVFLTCRVKTLSNTYVANNVKIKHSFSALVNIYNWFPFLLTYSNPAYGLVLYYCFSFFFHLFVLMQYQRRRLSKMNGASFFWSIYLPAVALPVMVLCKLYPPLLFPCSCHQSF